MKKFLQFGLVYLCGALVVPPVLANNIYDSNSDSFFNSSFELFYAGPQWFLNALPGSVSDRLARARAVRIQFDRDGDRTESTPNYTEYVGTLRNPFDVMLFSNVVTFASGGGTTSKAITPRLADVTPPPDAEIDWKNTSAGTQDFNTAANWNQNVVPGTGDVAWFTGAAVALPNLSASVNISGLYFSDTSSSGYIITNTNSAVFTLTANQTTVGAETGDANSVAIAGNNTSGTNSISVPIALAPVSGTNSTIFQAAGGTLILSGVISGSSISLTKTGGGTLTLQTSTNTYSGGTFINSGTVTIAINGSLGTGDVTLGTSGGGNATLVTSNSSASPANNITVASGSGGTLTLGSQSTASSAGSTYSGTITLNGDVNLTSSYGAGGSLKMSGVISGSGALTKVGTGEADLTGTASNTYTGLTTVSNGTLGLGKGTAGLNAFAGDLLINGGSVIYSSARDNQIPDAAKVTISSGSLDFGVRSEIIGSTGTSGLSITGGAITMSTGTVQIANSAAMTGGTITITGAGSLRFNTDFTFSGGTIDSTYTGANTGVGINLQGGTGTGITYLASGTSTAQITNSGGGSARLQLQSSATNVFNIADSASVATEMNISMPVAGTSTAIFQKAGAGKLTLSGTNTYTGATQVNAGTLLINGNSSASTGAVAVNNSGTVFGGFGTTGGKVTVAGGGTPGSGAIILGGSGVNDANKFGTFTVSNTSAGAITLQNGSVIELALGGTSTTHSTLAHTGAGTVSFASNQVFTFIDFGATTITYQDIVTGTGLSTLDTSGWSISNPGWAGSFVLDASGNIDLTLVAVPEPSTWIGGALALGAIGFTQRRRIRGLLVKS